MWGKSYLPDNLPRLYTYQDALNRYNETTPLLKGEDKGLLPLGDNRRYKRSQILKNSENGNIICRYWSTDVITFKENGEVEFFIGAWSSPTTLMFLRDVYGDRFNRYKNKIYFNTQDKHYLIHNNKTLTVKNNEPLNPLPEYAAKLNRAKMKEVQNRFAPFMQYCMAMVSVEVEKLGYQQGEEMDRINQAYGYDYFKELRFATAMQAMNSCPPLTTLRKDYTYRPQYGVIRHNFFEMVDKACKSNDLEAMYPLYFILATNASTMRWSTKSHTYFYSIDAKRLRNFFNELIKFQFTNIFDKEEQPLGIRVADSNAKYFL